MSQLRSLLIVFTGPVFYTKNPLAKGKKMDAETIESVIRIVCIIGTIVVVIKLSLGRTIGDLWRYYHNDKDSKSSTT